MWIEDQECWIIADANPFKVLAVVDSEFEVDAAENHFERQNYQNVISFTVPVYSG